MKTEKRLIDANALLIPKYESSTDEFIDGYRQGKIDAFIEVTALAPTVDAVEVVHGKWEYWAGGLARCPVCGYEYTDYLERDNYCGNCGAKMDGDGNDI